MTNTNNFSEAEVLKLLQTRRVDVKIKSLHEYSKFVLRADVALLIKLDNDTLSLTDEQIAKVLFNDNNADEVKPIIKNVVEKVKATLLALNELHVNKDGKTVTLNKYGLLKYNTVKLYYNDYILTKRPINILPSDLDSSITELTKKAAKALLEHLPYLLFTNMSDDAASTKQLEVCKKHQTDVNILFGELAESLHNSSIRKQNDEQLFIPWKQLKKGCFCSLLKINKKNGKYSTTINQTAILKFVNAFLVAEYNGYRQKFMHEFSEEQ